MTTRNVRQILDRAEETLALARLGAADVAGRDPRRRLPGLLNVAVFGRAVTNVLQNLRPRVPDFDAWYGPKETEMRSDPLLAFFYKLRTDGLKRADPIPVSNRAHIKHLALPQDLARLGPSPPGAQGFFIGDRYGGSGWTVVLPDGSQVASYVDLPDDIGVVTMTLAGAPQTHLGGMLADNDAASLCDLYVAYLTKLVGEARAKFAGKG